MTNKFLVLDFSYFSECNLCCSYCRDKNRQPRRIPTLTETSKFLDNFLEYSSASVFKTSGYGEITLVPYFKNLVENYSKKFDLIQIITNGTGNYYKLDYLKNLVITLSLDGNTANLNKARTSNVKIINKIKNNMKLFNDNSIPFEINTVITKYNSKNIYNIVENFYSKYNTTVIPFPVRPFNNKENINLGLLKEDINKFKKELNKAKDDYPNSLPPQNYLDSMIKFLIDENRKESCYVPLALLSVIPGFNVIPCACAGNSNTISKQPKDFKEDIKKFFKSVTFNPGFHKNCNKCFNHYELINMLIKNQISSEVISNPSLKKISNLNYKIKKIGEDLEKIINKR